MVARTNRWLFLPLALILVVYIRHLLGQTNAGGKVVEANIRVKIDTPAVLSLLESKLDSFTSPIAYDSNGEPIETSLPSPVLASEPLVFEPSTLDFDAQSVGMPQLITVKVVNPSRTQNLHLNSISGESHVFHPSFFKSKVVKAGENEWTTFDVVFLPRVSGAVRDTLYIHTSHGTFDFKVQGVGVPNPFRMRPLLGARIPLNATYSPLITMYNPFETTLQITEMYSSGGNLHLELLSGQLQGSKSLWEIRPYETKPIARANFFGRTAINHTSFIRVKTNLDESPSIILPVEVEVSESHGLYLSRELLDFGILKSGESKSLPLFVLNSGPQTVHIKSVSVIPDNPAIMIEPTVTSLKPGSKYLKIASVTLTPTLGSPKGEQYGHLEILAEDDRQVEYRLQVPFDSTILQGTLAFERSQTMFRVGRPPFQPLIRNISLANHFSVPLVLYDIRLSSKAQEYFTVLDFHGPFTLPPTAEWHRPFALQFQATSSDCLFNTTLRLSTNASLFNIPLYCYDGRVKYSLNTTENPNNEDVLDYGVLSESDTVTKHFFLINPNPIRITIVSFLVSDSIPFTSVELLQIEPANMSTEGARDRVQVIGKKQGAKGPFYVEPDMVAMFRVNITNPKKLGTFTGELLIHTSFDRILRVPVYYKTAVGNVRIIPDKNVFSPTFPYAIQKLPLFAKSYYPQTLGVRDVSVEPPDERFYFITERTEKIPHLKPQALTEVGTLVFDPLRGDHKSNYLGTGDSWSVADHSSQLDAKADRRDFSVLWDTWSSLQDDGLTQFNFSYVVHTEIDTTVPVPTEASLVWPILYRHKELLFPQTTIGNSSIQTLKLTNPTQHPVVVQPVLLHYYQQPQKIVQILFESGSIENTDFGRSQSSFSLDPDTWGYDTSLTKHILIPGSETNEVEIRVKFLAHETQLSSSLLILRNNLTGLEYVVLRGRGLEGQFSIDGVQPDTSSLLIQYSPSDLERCTEGALLSEPLKLTKVFHMLNSGAAPMRIRYVGLGQGGMCDGNGFSVLNCGEEIVIQTNKSMKLELSLVPDFTLSRVESHLTVVTMEGVTMTFPLAVLIPHNMLAVCYAVQPHSDWEMKVGYLITPVWMAILFFVTMLALIRTNFGFISPSSDADLPSIQPTGGTYFDFGDITKALHSTLLEKLDSLKKGVEAAQREQREKQEQAKKPPDKYSHHKHQQRLFSAPTPPSHHPPQNSPSSSPPSSGHSHRVPVETEVRRRATTHVSTLPPQGDVSGRTHSDAGSAKDARNSDMSSVATASSQGAATRRVERNRHTSEPAKKTAEQVTRSCSSDYSHHPTLGSTWESLKRVGSESNTQGIKAQNQSLSSKSASVEHQPTMTTDQETGMRKFIDQLSSTDQGPVLSQHDSSLKSKKPAKLSFASSETSSSDALTSSDGRSSASSASSSSAPTPVPQRKGKAVRRTSNSKTPKVSPAVHATTKQVAPSVTVPTAAVAPLSQKVVRDHFERKASESSLRSTDSDSTSSSTSEKSEKEEIQGENGEVVPDPPLAKEPGTGQTIPLLLAQEEYILSKVKAVDDDEAGEAAQVENLAVHKKEGEREGERVQERELERKEKLPPPPRMKSKKKLRQQQKKEDKLRRKERERVRHRERDGEKRKEVRDRSPVTPEDTEVPNYSEKQLPHSQSVEEGDEKASRSSSSVEQPTVKKIVVTSPKKPKRAELKIKSAKTPPSRARTAPVRVPTRCETSPQTYPLLSSPSLPTQPQELSAKDIVDDSDASPEVDGPSQMWTRSRRDTEENKESPESISPTLTFSQENSEDGSSFADQSEGIPHSLSHPMEAIPISALRAMRAKSTKQTTKIEEEEGAHVRVSSKKNKRSKESEKLSPRTGRLADKPAMAPPPPCSDPPPQAEQKSTSPKKKPSPKSFTDDVSTEGTPSPEPGNELAAKSKSSHVAHNSPHDIAATLLSKNPALKKRKVKNGQEGSDEADDGKYEKQHLLSEEEQHSSEKLLWAGDEDPSHKHSMRLMHYKQPTTLSLDAEPFYPSSDYVPQVKRYRSHYHHMDTPYTQSRQLPTPPGFNAAEESGGFERKCRVREITPPHHLSLRPQQRLQGNPLTPSPPPYPTQSDPPSRYYPNREGLGAVEVGESARYPRVPPDITTYEISPEEYYSGNRRHASLGVEGMSAQRRRMMKSSAMFDDQGYGGSHHQQHAAAVAYAAAQRRERQHALSRTSPNTALGLWDQPSTYHYTQEEEAALLRREREMMQKRLLRKYQEEQQAKMHARHSVDAFGHPPPQRPSRSTLYTAETAPPTSNLWDMAAYDTSPDSYPSTHQNDDAFLSESIHLHQLSLRQQQQHRFQLAQEHVAQPRPRLRRYSSDNELGGEILPDRLQTPSSPSHVSSSVGLNKAPGTAFSGMAQARRVTAREHDMWTDSQEKQGEPPSWASNIWSLDSPPFNAPQPHTSEGKRTDTGFPGSPDDQRGVVARGTQSPYLESTYDLFKEKNIWGVGTETPSANILPWSQLKSELSSTDPK